MATNTNPFYTYSATAGSSKTLQKPQDGGDNNQWGNYINTDLDEIVAAVNALSDKIADANEKTLVDFTATTDAVNHVGITNAAAGNGPTISAAGSESNVDLNVTAKGTGDINLTPGTNGDVNIPASKGITFGDDGEKIEGDGTDLTIASSNDLNLTATTDINVPANVGVTFGDDGEKIEGDGTDLTIASSGEINVNSGTLDLSAQTVDVTLNGAVDALNFDSNTLSIDASNNRIGIGTAAPSHVLEVEQTATSGMGLLVHRNLASGSTDNVVAKVHQNNASDDQTAFVVRQDGTGDLISLEDDGTEVFKISATGAITTPSTGSFNGTIGSSATVPASVGSSLVLLEKFTASSTASKDFDFTAYTTYNEYLFVFNGWQPSSNGTDMNVYLGSSDGSGGTTYASNTDDYRVPIRRWYYGGSGTSLTAVDDSVNTMFAFASSVNSSTNYPGVTGFMKVYVPRSSNKFTGCVFDYVSWTSNDYIYRYAGAGWRRSQLDNTHIRFVWSSGSILAGSIVMYGVKDA